MSHSNEIPERVTPGDPCKHCGKGDDRCARRKDGASLCYKVGGPGAVERRASDGSVYFVHDLPESGEKVDASSEVGSIPSKASPDDLDAVYSAMLDILTLSPAHERGMVARGFKDGKAHRIGYRSLPGFGKGRDDLLNSLALKFGVRTLCSVPGFYPDRRSKLAIASGPALLIPGRGVDGRIVGITVRPDERREGGPKYFWLSSKKKGGPGPGATVHVPMGVAGQVETVIVTEGLLKSDLTFALSGIPTIGNPGVSNWSGSLPILKAIKAKTVRIAYDRDWRDNPSVARSLVNLAAAIRKAGFKVEVADWDGEHKGIDDLLASGGSPRVIAGPDVEATIRTASEVGKSDGSGAAERATDRPAIEVNTERHNVLRETLVAIRSDPDLYTRGDSLVTVVEDEDDEAKISSKATMKGLAGSPKVIAISESILSTQLTAAASFFSWKKDKSGEPFAADVHPPEWLIKAVATRKHWPGIPKLLAVAECPFPRPDGSIVEKKGYDRETGTLYLPSIDFPPVPSNPTRDDARAAWGRISEYVQDFPFASEDDKVVYLAGVLTIIARPAIEGPVPGVAVNGNKAGVGKGLLIDGMVMPGTGRICPTSTYPESKEEAGKVKVSIALAAKVAVHFDNLSKGSTYGGGPLDSALTSTEIDDRQLGSNNSPKLSLRSAWFLSGNNVVPCEDAYRRWLVCRLETDMDHPDRRTDLKIPNLRCAIMEDRGEIVRDALTILRAHAIAGHPNPGWDGFGSFEDWDRIVRGAVWFATGRDCLTTQRATDEDSDERREQVALLEGWMEMPGGTKGSGGVTAAEAIENLTNNPKLYHALRGALSGRGPRGKDPSARDLGNILRGLKNTPVGPYVMRENKKKRHGATLWEVACNQSDSPTEKGESGESGESVSVPRGENSRSHAYVMASERNGESCRGTPGSDSPDSPDSPFDSDDPNWTPF